jgi:hypothetical protein
MSSYASDGIVHDDLEATLAGNAETVGAEAAGRCSAE